MWVNSNSSSYFKDQAQSSLSNSFLVWVLLSFIICASVCEQTLFVTLLNPIKHQQDASFFCSCISTLLCWLSLKRRDIFFLERYIYLPENGTKRPISSPCGQRRNVWMQNVLVFCFLRKQRAQLSVSPMITKSHRHLLAWRVYCCVSGISSLVHREDVTQSKNHAQHYRPKVFQL